MREGVKDEETDRRNQCRHEEDRAENDTLTRCHLQGPQLGHVVETGHGQPADVVVVEGAEEGEQQIEH